MWKKLKEKTSSYNLLNFPGGKRKIGKLDQTSSDFGVATLFAEVEDGTNNENSSDKEKEALKVIMKIMEKEGIAKEVDLVDILQSAKENTTESSSVKTKIRKTIPVGQKKEIKREVFSKVLLFIFFFILPLCVIIMTLYTIITGRTKINNRDNLIGTEGWINLLWYQNQLQSNVRDPLGGNPPP